MHVCGQDLCVLIQDISTAMLDWKPYCLKADLIIVTQTKIVDLQWSQRYDLTYFSLIKPASFDINIFEIS